MLSKKWRPFRQLSLKTSRRPIFLPSFLCGRHLVDSFCWIVCPSEFADRDRPWRRKGTKDGDDSAREAKLEWEGPEKQGAADLLAAGLLDLVRDATEGIVLTQSNRARQLRAGKVDDEDEKYLTLRTAGSAGLDLTVAEADDTVDDGRATHMNRQYSCGRQTPKRGNRETYPSVSPDLCESKKGHLAHRQLRVHFPYAHNKYDCTCDTITPNHPAEPAGFCGR
jgi:hypothetical protein